MINDTDTDPIFEYYCKECFKGHLPVGQICGRLPIEGHRATCLRCCNHNHG